MRSPDRVRRVRQRVLTSIVLIYTVVVLGAWIALWWADAWWPATLLMFAPRWIIALPIVILAPLTYALRSRTSALLLVLALVVSVPAVGFNIPWKRLVSSSTAGTPFRVMTLNMHYCTTDSKALEALIKEVSADVITIQEWSGAKDASILQDAKWHIQKSDRLFLASRYPIKRMTELGRDSMGENASVGHYELETPFGIVNIFSLHTATIRQGIYDTIHEKSKGPEELKENSSLRLEQSQFMAEQAKRCQGPVLLMGDFNTPRESIIFRKVWDNYQDAFSAAGWGLGYTFLGAHTSVRIDHVLLGPGWNCSGCRVGPYVGSPHRAVIADLHWKE